MITHDTYENDVVVLRLVEAEDGEPAGGDDRRYGVAWSDGPRTGAEWYPTLAAARADFDDEVAIWKRELRELEESR